MAPAVERIGALLRQSGDLLALVLIGKGVGGGVEQRQLHGIQEEAVVLQVGGVILVGQRGLAVLAVDQAGDGLGLGGVELVGFQRVLADAVGAVKVAVALIEFRGLLGGFGGGIARKRAAEFVDLASTAA